MTDALMYEFRIVLHSNYYDANEEYHEIPHGVRKHIGTEDSAMAAARRTRTQATGARIERVAVADGRRFQAHEVTSFTIGLEPR